jgi:hypothetical protein
LIGAMPTVTSARARAPGVPRLLATGLLALAAAATARPAHAGSCGGDEAVLDTVKDIERYAKRGGRTPDVGEFCVEEAMFEPALTRRILKACDAIVAREPDYLDCFYWARAEGMQTVGGVSVFAKLWPSYQPIDPFGRGRAAASFGLSLAEPRTVAPVREAWQAALADPRLGTKRFAHDYVVFRNNAIKLYGKLGGQPERDFLAAQLATLKDRAMKKRAQQAIKAIDRRLAAKP